MAFSRLLPKGALAVLLGLVIGCSEESAPGDGGNPDGGGGGDGGEEVIIIPGGVVTIGSPGNPSDWSGSPTSSGSVPLIVYPSAETRFPRNIYRTLFQWRTQGGSEFRLTFEGPAGKVIVYTDGAHALCANKTPPAGCWEADEAAWRYIAGAHAGQTVTWTLDGLDRSTTPPTVRRAAPITIGFSRRNVPGAVFYWSTTSAGIRRANIGDSVPEDYITGKPGTTYSSPTDQVKCVACHTVSRDGKYIAAPVAASSGDSLWAMEVTKAPPPTPLVKQFAGTGGHMFATFSPDDELIVAGLKKDGSLTMFERATGMTLGTIALAGLKATQPDWSPDNSQLAFSVGTGDGTSGAAIAAVAYLGNRMWAAPTTLVPSGGKTNLFPMFSPDGRWLAFARGNSAAHGEKSLQLFVTSRQGGNIVELINANRVVSNRMGDGQTENSQPTWAPPGDLDWIAFNSMREYGVVAPAGTQQIWVAAIDLTKLGSSQDPSYPAFRLQFQGLGENNHRAFWTLDVREPPPDGGAPPPDMTVPDGGMCIASGAPCDPVADRCCDPGEYCDTNDNGNTYFCVTIIR